MSVCSAHSLPYRRLTIPGHTITISLLLWPCQTPNLPVKTPLGISDLRLCTLGSLGWQLENGGTLYYIVKLQDFVFRTQNSIFVIKILHIHLFWRWVLFYFLFFDSWSPTYPYQNFYKYLFSSISPFSTCHLRDGIVSMGGITILWFALFNLLL